MEDLIKIKFENDDMKKAIELFSKSLKKYANSSQDCKFLSFEDGFKHAMTLVNDSFKTFLERYSNEQA